MSTLSLYTLQPFLILKKLNTDTSNALAYPDRGLANFEQSLRPNAYEAHDDGPVWVGFYQTSPIPIVMERKRGDG
jgi:hypothetical protein